VARPRRGHRRTCARFTTPAAALRACRRADNDERVTTDHPLQGKPGPALLDCSSLADSRFTASGSTTAVAVSPTPFATGSGYFALPAERAKSAQETGHKTVDIL